MEEVHLPMENAYEPAENARQPMMLPEEERTKRTNVRFENDLDISKTRSNANRVYKELLSQPPDNLTQLQKLQWLQKRRTVGLWVQCDTCDRWRYLPHILDSYELPTKWYCKMNPDTTMASCSIPEVPIQLHDEEDLIHSEYAAGSLVLARLPGWPWWPAMVDDCPDTEQYYWLDGFSDIPTHYNVVFFDTEVTRAWMAPSQMKPYAQNKNILKSSLKNNTYRKRMEVSIAQCEDAEKLPLLNRLEKYCFINRFKGPIKSPKKLNAEDAAKYRQRLKRKYNIDLPRDFFVSDEESQSENGEILKTNVIIVGSKKMTNTNMDCDDNSLCISEDKDNKESSLVVQVGTDKNDQTKDVTTGDQSNNKDCPAIHAKTTLEENSTNIYFQNTGSPHSDDFDF